MIDEQKQTIAQSILCILFALHTANDDLFEFQRSMAMLYLLKVEPATILRDTVSANAHRGYQLFFTNPESALSNFGAALKGDPSNPLIYLSRSILHVRLGQSADARADSESAASLAPKNWLSPMYALMNVAWSEGKLEDAIAALDEPIKAQPDTWYPTFLRGLLHFLAGNSAQARVDIEKSASLSPATNFPYIVGTLLALREGRMVDAANLNVRLLREFPDTTFGNLIIDISTGSDARRDLKELFNIASLLYLRRYTEVVKATDTVLKANITTKPVLLANTYLVRGFALCNLGDDRNAESAYTSGLALDPEYVTLYMLRAEVRRRLQNPLGAAQDILSAQAKSPANIAPYLQANTQGKLTCKNGLESLLSVTPQP
jgi:tetratricopeptide (TPR) repeat protein